MTSTPTTWWTSRFASNGTPVWSGGTIDAGAGGGAGGGLHYVGDGCGGAGQHALELPANDANLDFLAQGESITFSYTVTATDNHGGTDTDMVTLHDHRHQRCADGERDGGLGHYRGARCQRAGPGDSGTVSFDDIDTNDVVDITFASNGTPVWSGGTINPALAAALVGGLQYVGDGRGGAGHHALELRRQRCQSGLPGSGREHHLQLHGDGDRQPRRHRHRHGDASRSPAPTMRRR